MLRSKKHGDHQREHHRLQGQFRRSQLGERSLCVVDRHQRGVRQAGNGCNAAADEGDSRVANRKRRAEQICRVIAEFVGLVLLRNGRLLNLCFGSPRANHNLPPTNPIHVVLVTVRQVHR